MNLDTISRLRQRVKAHEGLRLKPYLDSRGIQTIGYGRNLQDRGISQEEAESLLDHDLTLAESELLRAWPWASSLDDARYSVLVEMSLNLGVTRLETFVKFQAALQAGDYQAAAREMLSSVWSSQVGARADRLAAIMRSGVDGAVRA